MITEVGSGTGAGAGIPKVVGHTTRERLARTVVGKAGGAEEDVGAVAGLLAFEEECDQLPRRTVGAGACRSAAGGWLVTWAVPTTARAIAPAAIHAAYVFGKPVLLR